MLVMAVLQGMYESINGQVVLGFNYKQTLTAKPLVIIQVSQYRLTEIAWLLELILMTVMA